MVFQNDDDEEVKEQVEKAQAGETKCCGLVKVKPPKRVKKERGLIVRRMRSVGLLVSRIHSSDNKDILVRITTTDEKLEEFAEKLELNVKLKVRCSAFF